MEQRRTEHEEERFLTAYGRLEKPLLRLVMFGFVLIILAQVVLAFPAGRQLLSSTDRLEGARDGSVQTTAGQEQPADLVIHPVGDSDVLMPDAFVKVDGVPVANFAQTQVTVRVHQGDVISIDTSKIPGVHRFQIDLNNPNISYPVPGTLIESNDDKSAEIGPVEFMK